MLENGPLNRIDKNNVITKDPVIGDLAVFFAQNEYAKEWEFKKKTLRSRKRIMSKLKN